MGGDDQDNAVTGGEADLRIGFDLGRNLMGQQRLASLYE